MRRCGAYDRPPSFRWWVPVVESSQRGREPQRSVVSPSMRPPGFRSQAALSVGRHILTGMWFVFVVVRNRWVRAGAAVLALVLFVMYSDRVLGGAADVSMQVTEAAEELIPNLVQTLFDRLES